MNNLLIMCMNKLLSGIMNDFSDKQINKFLRDQII